MINKNQFCISNDKKILHKIGKKWVTVSALTLALLGGTSIASHMVKHVNADTVQPNQKVQAGNVASAGSSLQSHSMNIASQGVKPSSVTPSVSASSANQTPVSSVAPKVSNSSSVLSVRPNVNSSVQSHEPVNQNQVQSKSNVTPRVNVQSKVQPQARQYNIMNQAKVLHRNIMANNAKPVVPESSVEQPQKQSQVQVPKVDNNVKVNKPELKLSQLGKMPELNPRNKQIKSANQVDVNQNRQLNKANRKPLMKDAVNSVVSGNYRGLNYKYNKGTKELDFINGTASADLSDFVPDANSDIKNATSMVFGNNVDTHLVANMNAMFLNDTNLRHLDLGNNFDTSSGIGMFNTFYGMSNLETINLGPKFDTSKVNNMWGMFGNDSKLKSIDLGNKFNTQNVTAMDGMFANDKSLTSLSLGSHFDTSKVTDMGSMFQGMTNLKSLDLGNKFYGDNVTTVSSMFQSDVSLEHLTFNNEFSPKHSVNMFNMFYNMPKLKTLDLGNNFDTSSATTMWSMFGSDNSLQSINLGNEFDTHNVKTMSGMFRNDYAIKSINLGNKFDTSNVSDIGSMFQNDYNLQSLDLGKKFNTKNVTNMIGTFQSDKNMKSLNLGSDFDTSNVTQSPSLFQSDSALTSLNLGNKFNPKNDTNMFNMFYHDTNLKVLNLGSNFDTSKDTNMWGMFGSDSSLKHINLGDHFNTSNVTVMDGMFDNDRNIVSIVIPKGFDTSKVTDMANMFHNNGLQYVTIKSPNAKFNPSAQLPNDLYYKKDNNQYSNNSTNLDDGQDNTGTFVPNYVAKQITNPNNVYSRQNPSSISDNFAQNYHFNNPQGQSNDIEAILPHYNNGKISYWDVYYLWNPLALRTDAKGKNLPWIPTDQWGHAVTTDFKSFKPADSENPLSINNVVIPDPEFEVDGVNRVEVEPQNKMDDIPWGQVAGGSIISNKKSDGSAWLTKDQWGNQISPDAQLAYFATYRSKPMANGENTGNYLAYANPNGKSGYQQFKPFSSDDTFDSTTIGEQPNQDGRDPFVTVNAKNNKQLVAYLAGGATHKVFELTSSDATDWKDAHNAVDLTNIMKNLGFTDPMSIETPHVSVINGQPILTFSAQDMSSASNLTAEKKQGMFYVTGHFNDKGLFTLDANPKYGYIDGGFDNYAGNFANLDANHIIYIGWLGNWYTGDGSHDSGFSLPRILTWNGNELQSTPVNPGALVNSDIVSNTKNQYQPNGVIQLKNINTPSNWSVQLSRSNADPTDKIDVSFNNGKFMISRNGSIFGEADMSRTLDLNINQLHDADFYVDNDSVEIYLPETKQMYTILNFSNTKNEPYVLSKAPQANIKSYQFGDKITFMDGRQIVSSNADNIAKGTNYTIPTSKVPAGYQLANDGSQTFTANNSNHIVNLTAQTASPIEVQYTDASSDGGHVIGTQMLTNKDLGMNSSDWTVGKTITLNLGGVSDGGYYSNKSIYYVLRVPYGYHLDNTDNKVTIKLQRIVKNVKGSHGESLKAVVPMVLTVKFNSGAKKGTAVKPTEHQNTPVKSASSATNDHKSASAKPASKSASLVAPSASASASSVAPSSVAPKSASSAKPASNSAVAPKSKANSANVENRVNNMQNEVNKLNKQINSLENDVAKRAHAHRASTKPSHKAIVPNKTKGDNHQIIGNKGKVEQGSAEPETVANDNDAESVENAGAPVSDASANVTPSAPSDDVSAPQESDDSGSAQQSGKLPQTGEQNSKLAGAGAVSALLLGLGLAGVDLDRKHRARN